jgi:hypothetical protein
MQTSSYQQPYTIESLELAIAALEPNPWNPNEMSSFMVDKAQESLDRFGQIKRVIVRPHPTEEGRYQILDGYHRCRIAGLAGETMMRCEVVHGIPDAEAKRLGLALNDIHGDNNREKLGQLLCDLGAAEDTDALPWNENEIEHLMGLGSDDDDEEVDEPEISDPPDTTAEPPLDELTTVILCMTPVGVDKLGQCMSLLQSELGQVSDQREATGLVVERLCEGYLGQ